MRGAILHPLIWIVEERASLVDHLVLLHQEQAQASLITAAFSPMSRSIYLLDEAGRNVAWVPCKSLIQYALNAGLTTVEPLRAVRPNVLEVGHA